MWLCPLVTTFTEWNGIKICVILHPYIFESDILLGQVLDREGLIGEIRVLLMYAPMAKNHRVAGIP